MSTPARTSGPLIGIATATAERSKTIAGATPEGSKTIAVGRGWGAQRPVPRPAETSGESGSTAERSRRPSDGTAPRSDPFFHDRPRVEARLARLAFPRPTAILSTAPRSRPTALDFHRSAVAIRWV